jgi:hypothetical protein
MFVPSKLLVTECAAKRPLCGTNSRFIGGA